jgi:ssDNA-binding replication factor A large subunit
MPLTKYVPDPEKWARYFIRVAEGKIEPQTGRNSKILIVDDDAQPATSRNSTVEIEPVTPVQRMNDRIESELRRIGALKISSKVRKRQHGETRAQQGGSTSKQLKRVSKWDTSGF